ncbi:MAG TPA: DUF3850 domain-containing protein [Steroidobacteraceae bacterium]|jgi:hypothetical protein
MRTIKLKIWNHWYDEVQSGRMTFQVRDDTDRCFQSGDQIEFQAWDTLRGEYVQGKPPLFAHVAAVYRLPGLQPGYVALSIKVLDTFANRGGVGSGG